MYILSNEQVVFSFQTITGKEVIVAKDTGNKYLVYRFGTGGNIEFEFPGSKEHSWDKFEYSFYLRGGGRQNEGMDLNYLQFTNEGYKYVVYNTYFASDNKSRVGVKVIQLSNNKIINIQGLVKSRKGSLGDFRNNEKIRQGDELFD
ncbi:hypothetical protein DC498_23235 [Terrimonas sp.]|nr:hypothetical protein DC498_23235 [Terrimonas sp.]